MLPKSKPWRNEAHRRLIASMACAICGRFGPSQCAHVNFGKGIGLKTSDALSFPACPDCHRDHDQGGNATREERHLREWELVDKTRSILIGRNQWKSETEKQYQLAIVLLARVVHAKECPTSVETDSGAAHNALEV